VLRVGWREDRPCVEVDVLKDGGGAMSSEQYEKIKSGRGFFAALDESGGSTPRTLARYGIPESAYSNDTEMFDLVHVMRSRIIRSPGFNGDRVLGAILFENTMDRQIEGKGSADYLWDVKGVVPYLKVDKGLEAELNGVQTMKPIPGLDSLLARARQNNVFGTKMRSFIKLPDESGIKGIVTQQFEIAREILSAGLVPIIEPEVDIHSPGKAEAESLLKGAIGEALAGLSPEQNVMLKLTLPEQDNLYADFVANPKVVRVLALSGGYSRDEADARLARNHGVIASFARALTEGLSVEQSDADFDRALDESIGEIFEASST
jgi:fructose-bisphosphate aldolase, class I